MNRETKETSCIEYVLKCNRVIFWCEVGVVYLCYAKRVLFAVFVLICLNQRLNLNRSKSHTVEKLPRSPSYLSKFIRFVLLK